MTSIYVELPKPRVIAVIPERKYKEYTWEMLEDTVLEEMDLMDLAEFIEDVAEQVTVTPDGEFCEELIHQQCNAARRYNTIAGHNIMTVTKGSTFLNTDIVNIKPDKRPLKRLGKEIMIEKVTVIKKMLRDGHAPNVIAGATGLSTTFISKVKTGVKYPEVTI